MAGTQDIVHRYLKVILVIATYWTISVSMVFTNKYLVGSKTSTNLAVFVAWMQCVVTVVFVLSMKFLQGLLRYSRTGTFVLGVPLNLLANHDILKMTVTFVGMLTFNNLCLKMVGVAFFQVARSTTLIFTVILSILILKRPISMQVFGCCGLVAVGFVLGVDQEKVAGTLSVKGVSFGMISSVCIAFNGIFTKKALDIVHHDSVTLALLSNMNAVVLFVPIIAYSGQLQVALESISPQDMFFWVFLLVSGIMAFSMAWISALQIDITSPVTHHISANCKAVFQTAIAVLYYQETKPTLWWASIALVVGGAFSYALIRTREVKEETEHFPERMLRV